MVLLTIVLVFSGAQGSAYAPTDRGVLSASTTHAPFAAPQGMPDPNQVFMQVNQIRTQKGLQPLIRHDTLAALAVQRAVDMSQNEYYGHTSASGDIFSETLRQNGYEIDYGCENLDLEFTADPTSYTLSWLGSDRHAACLTNADVRYAGYAVTTLPIGHNQQPTYVMVAIHTTIPIPR